MRSAPKRRRLSAKIFCLSDSVKKPGFPDILREIPFADARDEDGARFHGIPAVHACDRHMVKGRRNGRVRERGKPVFEKGEEILSAHDFIAGSMDDFVQKREHLLPHLKVRADIRMKRFDIIEPGKCIRYLFVEVELI